MKIIEPDDAGFEALDYRVMGHAYASQNELGRLCDEEVYEADMKSRLETEGICSIRTQLPLTVSHRDFSKTYRLDLLADGVLYELKTAACFTGEHEAQLLNYLLLLGLRHGKLLNFRPAKVQGQIVATGLTLDARRKFTTSMERWAATTAACNALCENLCNLLLDWGAFLDIGLYQEALVYFLGGPDKLNNKLDYPEMVLGWVLNGCSSMHQKQLLS